jgi:hypothetical protein
MTLLRLLWPAAMVIEERGTSKSFAKNCTQASLARPSIGGAVSATLRAPPTSPVMAFFFARELTLTAKVAPLGVSRIAIMERLRHGDTALRVNNRHSEIRTSQRPLWLSAPSAVRLLSSLQKPPYPRARTSTPLRSQLQNLVTCPWKAHPC